MSGQVNFKELYDKAGLNDPNSWKEDPREKFETVLGPLLAGTEYHLKQNTTDSSKPILELWRDGDSGRVMGFWGRKGMLINVFFNAVFYDYVNSVMKLPENEAPGRSQPYVKGVPFELIWNIICVATANNEMIL